MSSPLHESENSPVFSEKNWTLHYHDYTTSDYGSPDSSVSDPTWTTKNTNSHSDSDSNCDELVLVDNDVDEDERKTSKTSTPKPAETATPKTAEFKTPKSAELETPKTSEMNNERRVALNKVKKNLFGVRGKLGKKHGRRAGYSKAAEKAIKNLFREHINGGSILTSEVRWMRGAYPDISEEFAQFSDAQIKDKVWILIRKRKQNK